MRNDVQKPLDAAGGAVARSSSWNGFRGSGGSSAGGNGFFSVRSLSNYMRIVSSGASNVASTVRSAGASIVSTIADRNDDAGHDQVLWAGFDKLECQGDTTRQVLLLGYRSGFQVWDVEQADDVRQLVSRHDGSTYFLQMLKKPITSKGSEDKFADLRPVLVVTTDGSAASLGNTSDAFASTTNGHVGGYQDLDIENSLPTYVRFYSMRIHDYVHVLKFRTAIFSVRCSPRVVAISQASQIHCFNAATLEREYTILTYSVASSAPGSGNFGYGPLAVGTRWLAYSACPVAVSSAGRVTPQDVSPAVGTLVPPNGSLVAHYAKESSKQLAAGLVTLGDMGYKKLSKYYSELLADNHGSIRCVNSDLKTNSSINRQAADIENAGTVIVRDIVSKSIIVQFRAHTSPISALCFDPSGTLLVTASIHGHNINIFQIMPSPKGSSSGDSDANGTSIHLYKLQRGITTAVIQDISFSDDSKWIMISSSRGTSHLYALSPISGTECNSANIHVPDFISKGYSSKLNEQCLLASGTPITLSAISRIRNGSNGIKGAVSGAAAAATGKASPLSGAIASVFHNCKGAVLPYDISTSRTKNYLLVFSPSGCIIQYVLRHDNGENFISDSGFGAISHGLSQESESRLVVDALQKWDVCHKRNRRDRVDGMDTYYDHVNGENDKLFQKVVKKGPTVHPADSGSDLKPKQGAEETHHMYLSEVELHMHEAWIPLWAKHGMCFQVMEGNNEVGGSYPGGEVEIERIPTHTLEMRSKDLVPVTDYLQVAKFQNPRPNHVNTNKNGPLVSQKSELSEDGRLSRRSSCSSLDCSSENRVAEFPNGNDGNGWIHSSLQTYGDFVNNHTDNSKLKKKLEYVNNDESLKVEAQLKTVNNIQTEDEGQG